MLVPLAALGLATALLAGGAGSAVTLVEIASVDGSGVEGNGQSSAPAVSANGAVVAFQSDATNLAGLDPTPARTDIFVRDRTTGVTERISAGNGSSFTPSISDDGRWVAFQSAATDLDPPFVDTNGQQDIFLFDRTTDALTRITGGPGSSGSAKVSGDGNFVVFNSTDSTLVAGDTNGVTDVFRWARSGSIFERVSVNSTGVQGNAVSQGASVSDDGQVVAFHSSATNLAAGDANNGNDVFVRFMQLGTTEAVSLDPVGNFIPAGSLGSSGSYGGVINGNGTFVAFESWANGIVPGVSSLNVYVRNLVTDTTVHASRGNGFSSGSGPVAIADNGTVLFTSGSRLVAADTTPNPDVYRYTIATGQVDRVSETTDCEGGTAPGTSQGARDAAVSDDGTTAAFRNEFTNLAPGTFTFSQVMAVTMTATACSLAFPTTTAATTTLSSTPPPAPPQPAADLHVRKSAGPSTRIGGEFAPGEPITFTVEIENEGTLDAESVHLVDAISWKPILSETLQPPGSIEISVTGCQVSGTSIDCRLPTIVPGGKVTVTYTVVVRHPYRDVFRIDNDARVTTTSPESDVGDNRASALAVVSGGYDLASTGGTGSAPFVDLVVTKQTVSEPAFGEKFAPNELIEFVVEIANRGTADAHQVEFNDHVYDPYERFSSFVASADAIVPGSADPPDCVWDASAGGVGGVGPQVSAGIRLKCDDLGTIRAGESIKVRYSATVVLGPYASFTTGSGMALRNVANAYAVERDRNNEDNQALLDQQLDPTLLKCTAERCPTGTRRDDHFVGPTRTRTVGPTMTRPPPIRGGGGANTYTNIGEGWTVLDGGGNGTLTGVGAIFHAGNGHDRASCNGCRAYMWNGNDTYVGGPLRDVVFLGPGEDTARTGAGNDFVYARDGSRDRVDCGSGPNDVVHVDRRDVTTNCEEVVGADVNGNLKVTRRGERGLQLLFWIVNFGPATATDVRVRLEATVREASILRHRLLDEPGVKCSAGDSAGREGDKVTVACTIATLPKNKSKTMALSVELTRGTFEVVSSLEARASEPDHKPGNNDKAVSGTGG